MMRQMVIRRHKAALTEVTALNHEVLDDTVELRALVAETGFKGGAVLLHTGCQSAEILNGLRDSLFKKSRVSH